jgi:hypothetical protein
MQESGIDTLLLQAENQFVGLAFLNRDPHRGIGVAKHAQKLRRKHMERGGAGETDR